MTMNSNYQKRYTREFKEEAVRLLLTSGRSVKVLARELGTSHVSLFNWKEEALRNGRAQGSTWALHRSPVSQKAQVM